MRFSRSHWGSAAHLAGGPFSLALAAQDVAGDEESRWGIQYEMSFLPGGTWEQPMVRDLQHGPHCRL